MALSWRWSTFFVFIASLSHYMLCNIITIILLRNCVAKIRPCSLYFFVVTRTSFLLNINSDHWPSTCEIVFMNGMHIEGITLYPYSSPPNLELKRPFNRWWPRPTVCVIRDLFSKRLETLTTPPGGMSADLQCRSVEIHSVNCFPRGCCTLHEHSGDGEEHHSGRDRTS